MTFPLNYEASVNMALAYIKTWNEIKPEWQAKDIIVLFYDDYNSKSDSIGENYS